MSKYDREINELTIDNKRLYTSIYPYLGKYLNIATDVSQIYRRGKLHMEISRIVAKEIIEDICRFHENRWRVISDLVDDYSTIVHDLIADYITDNMNFTLGIPSDRTLNDYETDDYVDRMFLKIIALIPTIRRELLKFDDFKNKCGLNDNED